MEDVIGVAEVVEALGVADAMDGWRHARVERYLGAVMLGGTKCSDLGFAIGGL